VCDKPDKCGEEEKRKGKERNERKEWQTQKSILGSTILLSARHGAGGPADGPTCWGPAAPHLIENEEASE
jgi:hypothetical protein